MNAGARKFIACIALAAGVVVLDQFSKYIALNTLAGRPPLEILPVFQFALAFNQGAAFGFLSSAGGWQRYFLSAIAAVVSCALVVWMWRARNRDLLLICALALVLGGALGNLIDRVSRQHVVDFIVLHYRGWYFPAFNIADAAISIGAFGLIVDSIMRRDA